MKSVFMKFMILMAMIGFMLTWPLFHSMQVLWALPNMQQVKWVCSDECYAESEYLATQEMHDWHYSDIVVGHCTQPPQAPPTLHLTGLLNGGGPMTRGKGKQVHHCIVCGSTKHRVETCTKPAAKLIRQLQQKVKKMSATKAVKKKS